MRAPGNGVRARGNGVRARGRAMSTRGLGEDIARMANQIAAQFRHLPEPAAVDAVANHLRMFWDPRMRAELLAHLATGAAGLDPLVRAAATRLP